MRLLQRDVTIAHYSAFAALHKDILTIIKVTFRACIRLKYINYL